ncbi:glycosyltransferase family 4 protein [Bradyrhizobium sp. 76]|uniref:glycosyltransferase family 4 protein n=1 Tax=Bradyrhizobium sp. 76 TaxID=2782680 RepID=UPI001FFA6645|nr:glycosyltransferase family 4 protein [Bradyrhizobium sp. 76]MCK1404963.1 glycosyltransferase family 4 protein [Bradyrhizobium sp. 76]
MRILHLLNHTKRLNGHVHAAVDLACAQVQLGHSVAIASGGGDFDALLTSKGVESKFLNHDRRPSALPGALTSLRQLERQWRPDVIHAHMMTSAVLAWPICKIARIPLVTTVHNEFQKSSILMGLGTRVIAVSDAVQQSMEKRGVPKTKLRVVLNGTIGSARFEGKDRSPQRLDGPSILFVGGLHPRKGLPDLFKAFDIVSGQNQAARLYVVGDGPHRAEYAHLVSTLNCSTAVTFFGALDEPFPFLMGADIFVLPSHADPAPLVLSEAREAGCAVIATKVDGIPQLLEYGKAGILVATRDPDALARAICSLLQSPHALQEWRDKSQYNIDHLTIARVARDTLEIYADASRQVRGRSEMRANPNQA